MQIYKKTRSRSSSLLSLVIKVVIILIILKTFLIIDILLTTKVVVLIPVVLYVSAFRNFTSWLAQLVQSGQYPGVFKLLL